MHRRAVSLILFLLLISLRFRYCFILDTGSSASHLGRRLIWSISSRAILSVFLPATAFVVSNTGAVLAYFLPCSAVFSLYIFLCPFSLS